MDTKRLILSVSIMLVVVIGWQLALRQILQKHPGWAQQPATAPAQNSAVVASSATAPSSTTSPTASMAAGGSQGQGLQAQGSQAMGLQALGSPAAVPATLGNDAVKFPMVMTIDPAGAGIKSVVLSDYFETAQQKQLYKFQEPIGGAESVTRPLATRTITIDGKDVDASAINWTQASATPSAATYVATIKDGLRPVLELTKTFTLLDRDAKDGSKGFDVAVHQSFRNLSANAVKVSETINGPNPPARENDRSEDRRYVAGYDAGDKFIDTGSTSVSELKKDKPAKDLVGADPRPMMWVGACSSYFESILRPDYAGKTNTPAIKIASANTVGLDLGETASTVDLPTSLAVTTSDFTLAPGRELPFDLHVFFGPKQRQLLSDNPYYGSFPMHYDTTLLYISGPCGYITFTWLINLLYGILWFFHTIFRDWGIAIICLVVLVRSLLHPITKRSQINMLQMGKMGPEIERLKKKYGDNKDELNKAMMGVYKEQGLTPILGCLPMFLQTPIWIALWSALQSTFELRQAGFLRWQHLHLTWISDLSHPDALVTFAAPVSVLGYFHIASVNILPLFLAVVFFMQQQFQPAPPTMPPEQEQQRKMMKWMSLLFPIMLYSGPSGLTLYILTSTTIGIIESKIIRDHIKQREAMEKAGLVIVDQTPAQNGRQKKGEMNVVKKPQGKIAGFLAELKTKAEEIQREAERRSKGAK